MSQVTVGDVFAVIVFISVGSWLAYKYLWEGDLSDGIRDFHESPPQPQPVEPEPAIEEEDISEGGIHIHNEQNFYAQGREPVPEPKPIIKVRCEYCGTLHAEDEPRCPNCGASG